MVNFYPVQILAVAFGFSSIIPVAIALFMVVMRYRQDKLRYALLLGLCLVFLAIWVLSETLTFLFVGLEQFDLWRLVWLIGPIFLLAYLISFSLLVDQTTRDSFDPLKVSVVSILATALIILLFDPNPIFYAINPDGSILLDASGNATLRLTPMLFVVMAIVIVISGFTITYWYRIYTRAPSSLKSYARYGALGAFCAGLFAPLFNFLGAAGSHLLFFGIGTSLMAWVLVKEKRLAFLCSFEVDRIVVSDSVSGIALYNYNWKIGEKSHLDETLFAGMMRGVTEIMWEAVQRGSIQEVVLEKGIMLLLTDEKHPVVCALIASKSSRVLRDALKRFLQVFIERFKDYIGGSNLTPFHGADEIVKDIFSFIPERED